MKLAVVITEFPSQTETFIYRDVGKFIEAGHEVRLLHLLPYNKKVVLHELAKSADRVSETRPFLFSRDVLGALGRAVFSRSRRVGPIVSLILTRCWRDPIYLLKSLALIPKSLWFAESVAAWGADHVHAEFAGHPATAAWIVHRLTGIPFSVSCRAHDIFVTQALLEEKLGDSAFVRTVSHYNVDFLAERLRSFDPEKAHVIHSSIDLGTIAVKPPARGPEFRVLYVGSLEERKGVDDLLKALVHLNGPWQCTIIGEGERRTSLERLSQSLGVQDRVAFVGGKPFQEVSKAYLDADVVAAPSKVGRRGRTEGIPNVVIEALGHGRPVVTSRVSGIPELVRDGKTGLLIEPGDIDALAAALERLRSDPELGERLAAAGRRAVEEEFDLSVNTGRQLALFAQHAARQAPA